ncbi:MAG: hypothetical protein OXE96_09155 [Gemmatimonadetes bacterium]|nr:hypothetical protein [Gemmatimonadota bacterium]
MSTRAALGMVLLAVAGCSVEEAVPSTPVNLFDQAAAPVVTRRVAFDTLWVYGGATDTIMLNADRVAAFPSGDAAVLDLAGRRVHRVGANGVVWSWGTRGEGPGEIDHVRDLDVNAQGEVVLADTGNGRLLWVSGGDGTWLREVGLPEGTINVDAVASLEGDHYILSSLMYATALATPDSNSRGPITAYRWVRLSATGEMEGLVPFPWDGFHSMSFLQTVGSIAGARSSSGGGQRWVFGFGLGNGFFVFNDSVAEPYPYVRHADFPEVETGGLTGGRDGFRVGFPEGPPERVARDMAIRGDTVFVLAGNYWEIDRYESATGQYLDSMLLPVPLSQFAVGRDALIGIVAGGMYPQVIALRAK